MIKQPELPQEKPPVPAFRRELSLPSDPATFNKAKYPYLQEILTVLSLLHYSEADCSFARLAAEELLVNAAKHGNENDPKKKVDLTVDITQARAVITVEDRGNRFSPTDLAEYLKKYKKALEGPTEQLKKAVFQETNGRGLLLCQALADELHAVHVQDQPGHIKGLRVTLVFNKDSPLRQRH